MSVVIAENKLYLWLCALIRCNIGNLPWGKRNGKYNIERVLFILEIRVALVFI